jgi:hypothetical protein
MYWSRMVSDARIVDASVSRMVKTSFSVRGVLSDVSIACIRQCESDGT